MIDIQNQTLIEPNYISEISQELDFQNYQTQTVIDLTNEGATVPFIARYRKEKTGNLDEEQIRNILALKIKIENLHKAKETAINGITEQEKMTPELLENILKAQTLKEVEEIYKPYKSKKKTKAMIAIENGFQIFADIIKQNQELTEKTPEIQEKLKEFSFEKILEGCQEIIAAEIAANADLRAYLIKILNKHGSIISKYKTEKALEKLNEKDKCQIPKFEIYSDFSQYIHLVKPYQILALNRGENLGILTVKIEKEEEHILAIQEEYINIILKTHSSINHQLEESFKKGYTVLFKSVENEIRGNLSEIGEDDAIITFQTNLENLLMTKPEYGKSLLTIDPGFRAGCKIVILNQLGNPVVFDKIFLHNENDAKSKLQHLITENKPEVIIVGNGTGVKETIAILQEITELEIYIVNESGASVYSASKIAQEEFPELDSLDRGTISIGRRFIDPLSELVKVPVESIGVGLYQHDVPVKKLEEKLGNVVENVVNEIGINVNNASSYVLNYISGIDKRLAKKIYNHRPYKSRTELKKQMTAKTYEQAIGFLRIPESEEYLDTTDIHPEQYTLAKYVLENKLTEQDFPNHQTELQNIYPDTNRDTIKFILDSYQQAGKEKRTISTHKKALQQNNDLAEGDITTGIVKNVVAFGAFVDIGMKNDGLVHLSEIANTFVKDPNDFLQIGQEVQVKILKIDKKTGKIQLSIRDAKKE